MIAKLIAYNTIISIAARVLGTIIALVSIGFVTRYLGKEFFGEYITIITFVYTFSVFADLGLYSLLVRDISRPGVDEKKIVSDIFSLRVVSLIVAFFVAIIAGYFFPYSTHVKNGIIIGAFSFLFFSSSQVLVGVFQKYLKMRVLAIAELSGRFIHLLLILLFVYLDLGFLWIVVALVSGSFINFLITFFSARKLIPFSFRIDFVSWRKIIKEALPIAFSIVFVLIYFRLDAILLSVMKSPTDVGIYGIAYKVLENIIFIPAVFVGLIMPLLSKYAVHNIDKFKFIFQKTFDILVLAALPIVAGLILLAKPIILLIGGSEFTGDASLVLQILAFAIGIIFLGSLFGNSIIALGKQKKAAWIYASGAIFNIIANIIVIPKYSYFGAALTTIFTEIIVTLLMLLLIRKSIDFLPSLSVFIKGLSAAILMYVILYYLPGLGLVLSILLGAFIYISLIYTTGAIKKSDILLLVRSGKNVR